MRRRLSWWMSAGIVATAAAGLWPFWSGIQAWRGPPVIRLELVNAPNELNPERPDTVLEIANRGNVPVEVTRITTTCGCSMPGSFEPPQLAPGAVGRLPIHADTRPIGQKTVHIILETNRPELPRWTATVQIRGEEPTPPFVLHRFRDVELTTTKAEEDLTATVQVDAVESAPGDPWITRVIGSDPSIEIDVPRVIATESRTDRVVQRTYEIKCRFPAASWPGESLWTGEFRIETRTEPAMPTPLWRFILRRNSPIAVHPDRIVVFAEELAEGAVHRTVRLWRRDGAPLRLEQWSASRPGLTLSPLGSETAPIQVVRVSIHRTEHAGTENMFEGKILLHTDDPAQPTVALPVGVVQN